MNDKIVKPVFGQIKPAGSVSLGKIKSAAMEQQALGGIPKESLVLLLDCSISMNYLTNDSSYGPTCLDAAKTAAWELVSKCDFDVSEVGVCSFSDDAEIVCWPSASRAEVDSGISSIRSGTLTRIDDALLATIQVIGNSSREIRRAILMSDGISKDPSVFNAAVQCASVGIIVDTVGFGDQCDTATLEAIAKITGGIFVFCKSAADLVHQFKQLDAKTRGLLTSGD